MGGASSHIFHPYEDRSLSFYNLKEMFSKLCDGSIEAYEKADGINLYITWDFETETIKTARNKGHIKQNGLDRAGLESKFVGRGIIQTAFLETYDVLQAAFLSMTKQTLAAIFGVTGGIWYSLDILYPEARNLIQYDEKHLVFHKSGTMFFDWNGNSIDCKTDRHFKMLVLVLPHLNVAIEGMGWKIHGPSVLKMGKIDPSFLMKKKSAIDAICKQARMQEGSSIEDYLRKRLRGSLSSLVFVPSGLRNNLLDRTLGVAGAPTVKSLCKGQIPAIQDHIKGAAQMAPSAIRAALDPIEKEIHNLSCALLGGCQSGFVADGAAEVRRLRSEVQRAIAALQQSKEKKAEDLVARHLARLQSPDKINTAVEGIVFSFMGKNYKLTGNFAPANQIYGYVKYKLNPVRETAKDEVLKNFILGIVAG